MNKIVRYGVLLFLIGFAGCLEEEMDTGAFSIKFGTACGWCAGEEYIVISCSEVLYERNIPCSDEKGIKNKSRKLNADEWSTIIESFDYGLFKTLEYTDCNVCVDGCDEIIKITDGDFAHELRYSVSDEVEGMAKLRGILSVIMDEMRVAN